MSELHIDFGVNPEDTGTIYADGGMDISQASKHGAELIADGIEYVCPHGTGMKRDDNRPGMCMFCKREDDPDYDYIEWVDRQEWES